MKETEITADYDKKYLHIIVESVIIKTVPCDKAKAWLTINGSKLEVLIEYTRFGKRLARPVLYFYPMNEFKRDNFLHARLVESEQEPQYIILQQKDD